MMPKHSAIIDVRYKLGAIEQDFAYLSNGNRNKIVETDPRCHLQITDKKYSSLPVRTRLGMLDLICGCPLKTPLSACQGEA